MRRFASLIVAVASVLLPGSCSYSVNDGHVSRDRMAHIVEALNNQDAAALRGMFTDYALAEYSEEIDEGVEYLLSLFPDRDVIWRDPGGGDSYYVGIRDGDFLWVPSGFEVTSGGKTYSLYFEDFELNYEDPENVGIYAMGAVLQTDSGDSGLEIAFHYWAGLTDYDLDTSGPPGVFMPADSQLSHDRMAQIVDALNSHDAAALKGMFTEYAVAEHSTDIDKGLDYLLSLFPDGDIVWQEGQGGSIVDTRVDGAKRTVLLPTFYTVSSGGVDYRLFFADFLENTIDPDNVGIYAIGAVPAAEATNYVPEADLYPWAGSFDLDATGHPGIFVPADFPADSRMGQIAAALESHDASALKKMFSPYARKHSIELDKGLDYLLSVFPDGDITWTPDPAEAGPIDSYGTVESGRATERIFANYKVSAAGKDYWLYFSDVPLDELEGHDRVGLSKLGVTPWTEVRNDGPGGKFRAWSEAIVTDPNIKNTSPGIYVPE